MCVLIKRNIELLTAWKGKAKVSYISILTDLLVKVPVRN